MKISSRQFKKYWSNRWILGTAIAFFTAIFSMFFANLSQFENLELTTYDARFKLRGEINTEKDNIKIVAIDDQSFVGLNRGWPLSRNLFARAILNLAEAGAKLIILDIEFAEPDYSNSRADTALAAAIMRAGNVIVSGKLAAEYTSNDIYNSYLVPPIRLLLVAGAKWGLINVIEDADGFIRRYLLFEKREDKVYYPLGIQAFLHLRSRSNKKVIIENDGYFVAGNRRVPKKDFNSMLINYRGPAKSFPTYSFSSILDDVEFDLYGDEDTDIFEIHKLEGTFNNKIVFIGASAEVLQDNKLTPFFEYKGIKRKMPGVEMHANALSTLLRGDFIVPQSAFLRVLLVFMLSFATMFITKWLKPFRGMFAIIGVLLAYVIWSFYAFIHTLVWVQITAPITAIILSYFGNVVHQTLTEQRERIRIKKTWQHFMAKNVIDNMLESGEMPTFGGERRQLTVLFSDIRGFTTYTEHHASQQVVHRLNEYLSSMVEIIFNNAGTLDKFVGDEIMALYGVPHPNKNHAEKACITALQMVNRLRALQNKWSQNNEEYFQIGIGINSGKMIVGNLGSSQLFDYTVIGDEVNLGARLEGANKQYGTTIIISEFTYKAVRKTAIVRELDLVRVKGKQKSVRIYELRGIGSIPSIEKDLIIDIYHQGLQCYKERKWYQALIEYKRILEYFPTDGPTRVYIKRCLEFIENPPPENWDGVYEFTTK